MAYIFNPRTDRYHKEGSTKYVSRKAVRDYVHESIAATTQVAQRISTADPDKWLERMKQEIKAEGIRSYLAGRGGLAMMTASDWGRVGATIAEQYRYLDGLHAALSEGNAVNVDNRIGMYINSARGLYERGLNRTMKDTGRKRGRWVSRNGPNTCDDCKAQAAKGWVSIDNITVFPGAGQTQCLTACQCYMEYE